MPRNKPAPIDLVDDREETQTIDVTEGEALASAADAQHEGDTIDDAARVEPDLSDEALQILADAKAHIEAEGVEMENFISVRTFASQEDLMARVGAQPKGTEVALGLVIGVVRAFERRPSTLAPRPGQAAMPDSIRLKGVFEATVYETGEIVTATGCYLPAVMAEAIEGALLDGVLNVRLNMEISCVATGRMIPYRFKVRSFIATPEQAAIAAMRIARLKALGRDSVLARLTSAASARA